MLRDVVSVPLTLAVLCLLEVPVLWVNGLRTSFANSSGSDLVAGAVEQEAAGTGLEEP